MGRFFDLLGKFHSGTFPGFIFCFCLIHSLILFISSFLPLYSIIKHIYYLDFGFLQTMWLPSTLINSGSELNQFSDGNIFTHSSGAEQEPRRKLE